MMASRSVMVLALESYLTLFVFFATLGNRESQAPIGPSRLGERPTSSCAQC